MSLVFARNRARAQRPADPPPQAPVAEQEPAEVVPSKAAARETKPHKAATR